MRALAPLLLIAPAAGCAPERSRAIDEKSLRQKATDAAKAAPTKLTGEVSGAGWHIPWAVRDPKHPDGPPIPILIADSRSGTMEIKGDHPVLRLRIAHVQLFRNGVHAADVQAAKLTADQQTRTIYGSEGVTVTSLTDPPDTVVTADRITWEARRNIIVAEGHAQIVQRPHDGRPAFTHTGGRITFDTAFKKVEIQAQ